MFKRSTATAGWCWGEEPDIKQGTVFARSGYRESSLIESIPRFFEFSEPCLSPPCSFTISAQSFHLLYLTYPSPTLTFP
ncbi:hypothetical protein K443DRAFT_13686 [Laccaria amethystina LaAM-08-1]|uniref:Uncharacterized protein n=1 Tax=Laccaria amethystina LaAM-08-1 TaxID=1095629 RepID=A0A0C9WUS5_9AGAR|nr:hypothetical protein K443DRAFT_13686 [Laccaria amethystina LaAM-08-1]